MNHDETIIKNHFRQRLLAACHKNQWDIIEDPHFFSNYLGQLGYDHQSPYMENIKDWYHRMSHFSFLSQIIHEDIEEIILHSENWVQTFSGERKEFYDHFFTTDDYQLALELLCLKNRHIWNESNPFASYSLVLAGSKWRATFTHKSLSPHGRSKLFLRSQKTKTFPMASFSLSEGQEHLIKDLIKNKKNIIISGSTGSGKTSFLTTLLSEAHEREHVTVLEDTHEIKPQTPFTTNMLSSKRPGMSLKDYCYYAMRMRPDRMVLGEIRGPEVVPFLLSINTGHQGMMASLHANSALDSISRLSLLFQIYSEQNGISYHDIVKMICQGVDYIIHLKQKRVVEIIEILGCEGTTPYYKTWD